ncbi:hypothetical protein KM043_004805 [Ampulex compressa]|nr:hypothetical protein KM043_004805 [Ampulex compressa]
MRINVSGSSSSPPINPKRAKEESRSNLRRSSGAPARRSSCERGIAKGGSIGRWEKGEKALEVGGRAEVGAYAQPLVAPRASEELDARGSPLAASGRTCRPSRAARSGGERVRGRAARPRAEGNAEESRCPRAPPPGEIADGALSLRGPRLRSPPDAQDIASDAGYSYPRELGEPLLDFFGPIADDEARGDRAVATIAPLARFSLEHRLYDFGPCPRVGASGTRGNRSKRWRPHPRSEEPRVPRRSRFDLFEERGLLFRVRREPPCISELRASLRTVNELDRAAKLGAGSRARRRASRRWPTTIGHGSMAASIVADGRFASLRRDSALWVEALCALPRDAGPIASRREAGGSFRIGKPRRNASFVEAKVAPCPNTDTYVANRRPNTGGAAIWQPNAFEDQRIRRRFRLDRIQFPSIDERAYEAAPSAPALLRTERPTSSFGSTTAAPYGRPAGISDRSSLSSFRGFDASSI